MTKPSLPYWRLSSFYFCYFALLGALAPFWGLYLESLGMTVAEIGVLMAILMATRIIAPNLWGWLADRSGQRVGIIRWGAALTVLVFSAAFWAREFWQLAALMFGFTFFWNAVLPQFEVVTLQALGSERRRYSQIRVWGSVGFIVAVVGLGILFDAVSIHWLVPILWLSMLMTWFTTLWVRNPESVLHQPGDGDFFTIARRPQVLVFLIVSLLAQLGHGPYYAFYSIYMAELGYSKTEIGLLWAVGVLAEVLIFLVMHRLLDRVGLRGMVIFSMLICVLRWCLIGLYPEQLLVVLAAQLMHAITFGCLHASSIALVHHFFPAAAQGQGQALYSSFGFGVGGSLGAYGSGLIWTQFGGSATFLFAALVSLIGLALAWRGLRLE